MDVVALQQAQRYGKSAYTPVASSVAPTSPRPGSIWYSRSMKDVQVSHSLRDRNVLFTPVGSENGVQETSIVINGSYFNALMTVSGGVCLRQCPLTSDPLDPANWTKFNGPGTAGAVIGGGAAGVATQVNHGQAVVFGSTIYYYGNVQATSSFDVWTAALSDPTTWTRVGSVFTSTNLTTLGSNTSGSNMWGNCDVIFDNGTYYMLIEYFHIATNVYQMVWATASSPTGTWTLAQTSPLASGYVGTGSFRFNSFSGPKLVKENGQWILFYHSNNWWGLSAIFRATVGTLGTDSFNVLDQPASNTYIVNPWIQPVGAYEVEQCADIEIVTVPSGQTFAMWTAADNRSPGVFRVMAAPLLPVRREWDGHQWHALDPTPGRDRGIAAPTKPVTIVRTTDFSGTATAYATFMSQVHASGGSDVDVSLTAVVTATTTGVYQFRAKVFQPSTITAAMGGVYLVAGQQTSIQLRARLAKVTPGWATTYYVEYQCPASGGLNCRPVAQAAIEVATMTLTDVAYRPI